MKKLLISTICMLMASIGMSLQAQAQSSPIEEFITANAAQEGASYVEMSKTMLDAAFKVPSDGSNVKNKKYPRKFKSLILTDVSKAKALNQLMSNSQYEVLMSLKSTKEDKKTKITYLSATTYYFHNATKADEKEIIIVQQDEDRQIAITYMQGDLNIDDLQDYLLEIRIKLSLMNIKNGLTSDLGVNIGSSVNNFTADMNNKSWWDKKDTVLVFNDLDKDVSVYHIK